MVRLPFKMPRERRGIIGAVVVAQLVERSLPIPEAKFIEHLFTDNCIEKAKIKKMRPGMAHLKKVEALFKKQTPIGRK